MKENPNKYSQGFIALIAVILLAFGTTAFSLATLSSAFSYADTVAKMEIRIQARLNLNACLDTLTLMISRDYFLNGNVTIREFACEAKISNDFVNPILLEVKTMLNEVSVYDSRIIYR
ncbi:MAG: hypothetical protein WCW03_00545 [Candidatus Paceibacterota bacterium]|jgi:hypothetical protein